MEFKLYDIECYINYFQTGFKDFITKETVSFEISEEYDQRWEIYRFFTTYKGFLVSFNGIHYDNMVIQFLLSNWNDFQSLPKSTLLLKLKQFSDLIIQNKELLPDDIRKYKYFKKPWIDIDLFLYWSKLLRISKKLSLKSLGIQLGYPIVQELPFKPDTILSKEDLPKLRKYNLTHDLGILEMLTEKMKEDIKLREYIKKEYNLECWSMDAPKIASEYLLEYYCQHTYSIKVPNKEIPYWEYKREIRNTKYYPAAWVIGDYLPQVNFKTEFFQKIDADIRKSTSAEPYNVTIPFFQESKHALMLSISQGGIHSENDNQIYEEDNDYYIVDADISGLYPTLFREYKFLREELHIILDKYVQMIDDRTIAKRIGDKKKDTFLKLCNNAFSGLVDSNVTWLYNPEHILALRIFGQLIQLRFMEELNFHEISILFTNTDGTLCKVPKDKIDIYHQIAIDISKEFKVEWEFCLLTGIYFQNTNCYISNIREEYMLDKDLNKINVKTSTKIKRKGKTFRYGNDIPLGDSTDTVIIAKALNAYYIENIEPEEFINNSEKYNLHIYDFCKSNKIDSTYEVFWNNQPQQRLNRYYFSKNGPYLFKRKKGKSTLEHVNVNQGVILFNEYEDKPWEEYKINTQYYINKVKEVIIEMNNNNQLSLF